MNNATLSFKNSPSNYQARIFFSFYRISQSFHGVCSLGQVLLRQAAEGLAFLHSLALIHRNIKPSNVMLAEVIDGNLFRTNPSLYQRIHRESWPATLTLIDYTNTRRSISWKQFTSNNSFILTVGGGMKFPSRNATQSLIDCSWTKDPAALCISYY